MTISLMTGPAGRAAVTRRRFLGVAAGTAAGLVAAGCTRDEQDSDFGDTAEWLYTDARGRAIERLSAPRTVVTYTGIAAALWDYGVLPVGVFGALSRSKESADTSISGELDLSTTESVGEVWGQVEIEKIAALAPDVVVVPQLRGSALLDDANCDAVQQVSTVLFVETAAGTIDEIVHEVYSLAVEFGSTVDVGLQRREYEAARTRVSDAAAALGGAPVMFVSADTDAIRVARSGFPILADLAELGVPIVDPSQGSSAYVENCPGRWRVPTVLTRSFSTIDHPVCNWTTLPTIPRGRTSPR